MVNRKRTIVLRCLATAEERDLIEQKMVLLPTQRIGAYLRKMVIDGYIICTDTRDIKEMDKTLSAINRNINQIAKRLNADGAAYQADMEEIQERLNQIWQLQRRILIKSTLKAAIDSICNPGKTAAACLFLPMAALLKQLIHRHLSTKATCLPRHLIINLLDSIALHRRSLSN